MSKIHIVYTAVIDRQGKSITVGGIQNYLIGLAEVLKKNDKEVVIYQNADVNFKTEYRNIEINGIETSSKDSFRKQIQVLYKNISSKIRQDDIVIFGTDKIAFNNKHAKTIAIQHGISFDYIAYHSLRPTKLWKTNLFGVFYKIMQCSRAVWEFSRCNNVVCVDYNFLNWIRAVMPRNISRNAFVIPNYAIPSSRKNIAPSNDETIKILFARRLEFMRGVPILIDLIKMILKEYDNVKFTICGEGSMKTNLEKEFNNNPKVEITKFNVGEAEEMNLRHHITLVPTYGSEGTSFSLLEGMAVGAVPIASNVGGMTNIIIDGFNGYLVNPDASSFYNVLSELLDNRSLLLKLSNNAKETISQGFSKDIWERKWMNVIHKISN